MMGSRTKLVSVPGVGLTKHCTKCGRDLPVAQFYKSSTSTCGLSHTCKGCIADAQRTRLGQMKYSDNTSCSQYLGVHIAEPILLRYYSTATKMPVNNPGYDYICGQGYKIDVKAASLHVWGYIKHWVFDTRRNTIADFFMCMAFDNRHDCNLLHVWLLPRNYVNGAKTVSISNSPNGLLKWKEFELEVTDG